MSSTTRVGRRVSRAPPGTSPVRRAVVVTLVHCQAGGLGESPESSLSTSRFGARDSKDVP